ncbi:MAG TPA: hypothetical protein VGI67_14995 [Thermoleophilaceae bacterium]
MEPRKRIYWYGSALVMVVVGVVCGFAVPGLVGDIIRLSLITIAMGEVLLLVFYEIGLSEDRQLAKDEEERRRRQAEQPSHEEPRRGLWSSGRSRRPS